MEMGEIYHDSLLNAFLASTLIMPGQSQSSAAKQSAHSLSGPGLYILMQYTMSSMSSGSFVITPPF
jgi:hypothetical protein